VQRDYVLQVRNLSKSFAGVPALQNVRLDLERGQVHALLGENGAGKSTLVHVLAGLHQPDAGEVRFQGRAVRIPSPQAALKLGLAMIHQELMPFPDLSVAENIFMGQLPVRRFGWVHRRHLNDGAARLLARLGLALAPTRKMGELSVSQMQTVEIAKALAHHAEVIIMDEPTSAISDREIEALFALIGELRRQGVAVVYISHKLEEIFRIADMVTVLRDGQYVATEPLAALDRDKLISLMVGRELRPAPGARAGPLGSEALSVRGLGKRGQFENIHFTLRHGEVLGLAGLMGAGRTEVVNAIYGLAPAERGEIRVRGRAVRIATLREAIRHGIAWVGEDRQRFGLVPPLPLQHNLTLSNLRRCCRGLLIRHREEDRLADERIRHFGIKPADRHTPVRRLSGGNQQKVVLAKALLAEPDILLLDEPTRGIDLGAKADVYALIGQLAREGKAILLVSSELPELLALSDRILVLRQGAITAELCPRETSQAEILKLAMPV
jgi:ABC-type sugar transport system ATPase subunit